MWRDWMSTFRGEATPNPYGATALASDLLADRIAGRVARGVPDSRPRCSPARDGAARAAGAKRPT